jgi:hypothetical protein
MIDVMNLEKINEYYISMGIKTYWSTESLSIEEINTITRTFKTLHKKYPHVIIEEIGDCYTVDKTFHNKVIISGEDFLKKEDFSDSEFYTNNPELIDKAKRIIRNLLKESREKEIRVGDDKYINADYSAEYQSLGRKIIFNHSYNRRVKENMYHEFGHAVAFQYNINNNAIINEIFETTDKNRIEELVSNYATTEVEEFLAEAFMYYHLGRRNSIINNVMNIIDDEVLNGKPMSYTERFIYNAIHN